MKKKKQVQRSARPIPCERTRDPIANLPNICLDEVLSYFTVLELIPMRSVSKTWMEAMDWRLSSKQVQSQIPYLDKGDPKSSLELRRAGLFLISVYRPLD
jgi:hypothetical protein